MTYYAGLDVSMNTTFICIVDEKGRIKKEMEAKSTPESIHSFISNIGLKIESIGLESGALTHYLIKGLKKYGYVVIGMESRKMAAILATVINKTDKNDARGIAEALRAGHFKESVHRSDEAVERRTLLHIRKTIVEQRTLIITSIKGYLKVYGIRLGAGTGKKFLEKIEREIASLSLQVQKAIQSLMHILESLESEIQKLDVQVKSCGKKDNRVELLQTVDGVGPITALAFVAEIDDVERFKNSKDVAAYIGLTPRQYSSGQTQKQGKISKKGSKHTRSLLVEAALSLLIRCKTWSKLKAWGHKLMKKIGKKKAIVAVARKLAVIMHRMLLTNTPFQRGNKKEQLLAA